MARKRSLKSRTVDEFPRIASAAAAYRDRMANDPDSVPGILGERARNLFGCDLLDPGVVGDLDLVCLVDPVEAAFVHAGGPHIPMTALARFDHELGRRWGRSPPRS